MCLNHLNALSLHSSYKYSLLLLLSVAHIIEHFSYMKHVKFDVMYCTACVINKYQIQRTAYVSAEN